MVDDNLLSFDLIINQVLTDSFHQNLPVTFKSFSESDLDKVEPSQSNPAKRQRVEVQNDRVRIQNEKTIKDWIVNGSDYAKKFAGKHLDQRPKLQGVPMCPRWHSKGYCFSNCPHKITHVDGTQLNDSIRQAYSKFVAKCKSA